MIPPIDGCIILVHMEESLYDYVMDQLEASKGSWPTVAADADVALSTLVKIARREIADPGVSHIEKLAKHFRSQATA